MISDPTKINDVNVSKVIKGLIEEHGPETASGILYSDFINATINATPERQAALLQKQENPTVLVVDKLAEALQKSNNIEKSEAIRWAGFVNAIKTGSVPADLKTVDGTGFWANKTVQGALKNALPNADFQIGDSAIAVRNSVRSAYKELTILREAQQKAIKEASTESNYESPNKKVEEEVVEDISNPEGFNVNPRKGENVVGWAAKVSAEVEYGKSTKEELQRARRYWQARIANGEKNVTRENKADGTKVKYNCEEELKKVENALALGDYAEVAETNKSKASNKKQSPVKPKSEKAKDSVKAKSEKTKSESKKAETSKEKQSEEKPKSDNKKQSAVKAKTKDKINTSKSKDNDSASDTEGERHEGIYIEVPVGSKVSRGVNSQMKHLDKLSKDELEKLATHWEYRINQGETIVYNKAGEAYDCAKSLKAVNKAIANFGKKENTSNQKQTKSSNKKQDAVKSKNDKAEVEKHKGIFIEVNAGSKVSGGVDSGMKHLETQSMEELESLAKYWEYRINVNKETEVFNKKGEAYDCVESLDDVNEAIESFDEREVSSDKSKSSNKKQDAVKSKNDKTKVKDKAPEVKEEIAGEVEDEVESVEHFPITIRSINTEAKKGSKVTSEIEQAMNDLEFLTLNELKDLHAYWANRLKNGETSVKGEKLKYNCEESLVEVEEHEFALEDAIDSGEVLTISQAQAMEQLDSLSMSELEGLKEFWSSKVDEGTETIRREDSRDYYDCVESLDDVNEAIENISERGDNPIKFSNIGAGIPNKFANSTRDVIDESKIVRLESWVGAKTNLRSIKNRNLVVKITERLNNGDFLKIKDGTENAGSLPLELSNKQLATGQIGWCNVTLRLSNADKGLYEYRITDSRYDDKLIRKGSGLSRDQAISEIARETAKVEKEAREAIKSEDKQREITTSPNASGSERNLKPETKGTMLPKWEHDVMLAAQAAYFKYITTRDLLDFYQKSLWRRDVLGEDFAGDLFETVEDELNERGFEAPTINKTTLVSTKNSSKSNKPKAETEKSNKQKAAAKSKEAKSEKAEENKVEKPKAKAEKTEKQKAATKKKNESVKQKETLNDSKKGQNNVNGKVSVGVIHSDNNSPESSGIPESKQHSNSAGSLDRADFKIIQRGGKNVLEYTTKDGKRAVLKSKDSNGKMVEVTLPKGATISHVSETKYAQSEELNGWVTKGLDAYVCDARLVLSGTDHLLGLAKDNFIIACDVDSPYRLGNASNAIDHELGHSAASAAFGADRYASEDKIEDPNGAASVFYDMVENVSDKIAQAINNELVKQATPTAEDAESVAQAIKISKKSDVEIITKALTGDNYGYSEEEAMHIIDAFVNREINKLDSQSVEDMLDVLGLMGYTNNSAVDAKQIKTGLWSMVENNPIYTPKPFDVSEFKKKYPYASEVAFKAAEIAYERDVRKKEAANAEEIIMTLAGGNLPVDTESAIKISALLSRCDYQGIVKTALEEAGLRNKTENQNVVAKSKETNVDKTEEAKNSKVETEKAKKQSAASKKKSAKAEVSTENNVEVKAKKRGRMKAEDIYDYFSDNVNKEVYNENDEYRDSHGRIVNRRLRVNQDVHNAIMKARKEGIELSDEAIKKATEEANLKFSSGFISARYAKEGNENAFKSRKDEAEEYSAANNELGDSGLHGGEQSANRYGTLSASGRSYEGRKALVSLTGKDKYHALKERDSSGEEVYMTISEDATISLFEPSNNGPRFVKSPGVNTYIVKGSDIQIGDTHISGGLIKGKYIVVCDVPDKGRLGDVNSALVHEEFHCGSEYLKGADRYTNPKKMAGTMLFFSNILDNCAEKISRAINNSNADSESEAAEYSTVRSSGKTYKTNRTLVENAPELKNTDDGYSITADKLIESFIQWVFNDPAYMMPEFDENAYIKAHPDASKEEIKAVEKAYNAERDSKAASIYEEILGVLIGGNLPINTEGNRAVAELLSKCDYKSIVQQELEANNFYKSSNKSDSENNTYSKIANSVFPEDSFTDSNGNTWEYSTWVAHGVELAVAKSEKKGIEPTEEFLENARIKAVASFEKARRSAIEAVMREKGIDGDDGQSMYLSSKESIGYESDARALAPVFYSRIEKLLDDFPKKINKAYDTHLMNYLMKRGVSYDELRWSGLLELFKTYSTGSITSKPIPMDEVKQLVKESKLKVIVKTSRAVTSDFNKLVDTITDESEIDKYIETLGISAEEFVQERVSDDDPVGQFLLLDAARRKGKIGFYSDLIFDMGIFKKRIITKRSDNGLIRQGDFPEANFEVELEDPLTGEIFSRYGTFNPKFGSYQEILEGGDNYREILLKLDSEEPLHVSTHFSDDMNIIAHARVKDVTTKDGRKILFVEEIQSDWHNDLLEYIEDAKEFSSLVNNLNSAINRSPEIKEKIEAANGVPFEKLAEEFYDSRFALEAFLIFYEELVEAGIPERTADLLSFSYVAAYNPRVNRSALGSIQNLLIKDDGILTAMRYLFRVPRVEKISDAPFKNTYQNFMMKYLLRMAAEGGYDSIAWTDASRQIRRWSASYKKAYEIEYDQQLPSFINRYGRQWGMKAELRDIYSQDAESRSEHPEDAWISDLTPDMKESVMYEGQSFFLSSKSANNSLYKPGTPDNKLMNAMLDGDYNAVAEVLNDLATKSIPKTKPIVPVPQSSNARQAAARAKNYSNISKYGALPHGEKARVGSQDLPRRNELGQKTRKFAQTVIETNSLGNFSKEVEVWVADNIASHYEVASDAKAISYADRTFRSLGLRAASMQIESKLNGNGTVRKNDIALAEKCLMEAARNKDTGTALKLLADVAILGTISGQNVQALRLLKNLTPEGQLYYAVRAVNQLNSTFKHRINIGTNSWFNRAIRNGMEEIVIDDTLAQNVLDARNKDGSIDTYAMEDAMNALIDDLARQIPSTLKDKWNSWRYFAMLSAPLTHIRNMAGNAIFAPLVMIKDAMKSVIEYGVVSAQSKGKLKGFGEVNRTVAYHDAKSFREFCTDYYEGISNIVQGESKFNTTTANAILHNRPVWGNAEFMNKTTKFVTDMLEREDGIFLKGYFVNSMSRYLAANNVDPNNINDAQYSEIIEKAVGYAIEEAQRNTYRDASVLAQALNKVKKVPGAGFLLDGILPFTKTPINILSRGIEYSPVGFFKTFITMARKIENGQITNGNEFIEGLCENMTGTMIAMVGYFLAKSGVLKGAAGDDEEDKFDELQGLQSYSISIGNSNYTIDWMSPAALPLFTGAALWELAADDDLSLSDFSESLTILADPMLQLSMLDGLNSTLQAVSYSNDESMLSTLFKEASTSYIAQAIPTVLGQIARVTDGTRRSSYVDKNKDIPDYIQYFIQSSIKGKIPVVEGSKMAYVDAWGRKETDTNMAASFLKQMISPGYYKRINSTDVDKAIAEIYADTKETSILPSKGEKYVNIYNRTTKNIDRIDYTAEQYEKYLMSSGQTKFDLVNSLINNQSYDLLNSDQKQAIVSSLYSYAELKAQYEIAESIGRGEDYLYKHPNVSELMGMSSVVDYYLNSNLLTTAEDADNKYIRDYEQIDAAVDSIKLMPETNKDVVIKLQSQNSRIDELIIASEYDVNSEMYYRFYNAKSQAESKENKVLHDALSSAYGAGEITRSQRDAIWFLTYDYATSFEDYRPSSSSGETSSAKKKRLKNEMLDQILYGAIA